MARDPIAGATTELPSDFTAEAFDRGYAQLGAEIVWRLAAEAYGDQYPSEVRPYGMTTTWLLGRYVSELRLDRDRVLVDLACGSGGPGLWVARATGARLVGVDWSRVGVATAAARAPEFVPDGRAHFRLGTLAATGLPDSVADAAMCADAIFFAPDRIAAFAEVGRIIRPGAHFVFTCMEDRGHDAGGRAQIARHGVPDWTPIAEAGGLRVERKEEIPGFAEQLHRMYRLWLENIDALRAELGDETAGDMEQEARSVGPTLDSRTPLIITAVRP